MYLPRRAYALVVPTGAGFDLTVEKVHSTVKLEKMTVKLGKMPVRKVPKTRGFCEFILTVKLEKMTVF